MTRIPLHAIIGNMRTFHRLRRDVGIAVLDKAGWVCGDCGSSSSLCVHHTERMDISDQNYNEATNLAVLCRKCHMAHHRKAGHIIPPAGKGNQWGRRGRGNPPVFCMVDGCDKMQHAKHLCNRHYMQRLRND